MQTSNRTQKILFGLGGLALGYLASEYKPQPAKIVASYKPRTVEAAVNEIPSFARFDTTSRRVAFQDDLAPGMKAFGEYNGKRVELENWFYEQHMGYFLLPSELIRAKEFAVFAIDREGNKSEPRKIFTLDGVLLDTAPTSR